MQKLIQKNTKDLHLGWVLIVWISEGAGSSARGLLGTLWGAEKVYSLIGVELSSVGGVGVTGLTGGSELTILGTGGGGNSRLEVVCAKLTEVEHKVNRKKQNQVEDCFKYEGNLLICSTVLVIKRSLVINII